jgi:hypothetical protein
LFINTWDEISEEEKKSKDVLLIQDQSNGKGHIVGLVNEGAKKLEENELKLEDVLLS